MPPFRDDQIFIIAPGSQTTLAQLGLPESFTPARFRFRSCMFTAQKPNEFEAVKIRRKERPPPPPPQPAEPINGQATDDDSRVGETKESENNEEWEEDRLSEEDAIWPIQSGRIVDWPAFYALMTHVHNTINPPFHTPIMLVAEPVWTSKDRERLAQFFFEKFKVPAFTLVDAALAASFAFGVQSAIVVDVGKDKADITCIADFVLHEIGRSIAVPNCGGEAMTKRLQEVLHGRSGFTRDVCEQLKKSTICEILAPDSDYPKNDSAAAPEKAANPAAAASTGQDGVVPGQRKVPTQGELPRGPGPDTEVGEEKKLEDDEGILDIAGIVTSGNMTEYLAQKDKEKQEKKQQKKGNDAQQQNQQKQVRLANAKRARNTFIYEDHALHDAMKRAGVPTQGIADMQSTLDGSGDLSATDKPAEAVVPPEPGNVSTSGAGNLRREIEVGPERFQAASGGIIERLAASIHRTVLSCSEANKRADLWDSLIVVGNGAKIRGFKESLLHVLHSKYLISPSSATIFTSELPSNLTTPVATGTNTPQPLAPGQQMHHPSSVNPLLIAATTAQTPSLQHSNSVMGQVHGQNSHSSHGQTPTSIKLAKIPEYFPEWKEVGYEEAQFLGAQVAAKVLFITDGGASKGYMTRTDYNDQGPMGIHEVCV